MENIEKNWDNLTKGDVLVNDVLVNTENFREKAQIKVLAVLDDVVFTTKTNQYIYVWTWTKQELQEKGWTIKQPEPDRWKPKEGERFYFIGVQGEVAEAIYDVDFAKECEFGNCFKTKEQAQEAAENVKELLLGLKK